MRQLRRVHQPVVKDRATFIDRQIEDRSADRSRKLGRANASAQQHQRAQPAERAGGGAILMSRSDGRIRHMYDWLKIAGLRIERGDARGCDGQRDLAISGTVAVAVPISVVMAVAIAVTVG